MVNPAALKMKAVHWEEIEIVALVQEEVDLRDLLPDAVAVATIGNA